jgi:hypothetical protein
MEETPAVTLFGTVNGESAMGQGGKGFVEREAVNTGLD